MKAQRHAKTGARFRIPLLFLGLFALLISTAGAEEIVPEAETVDFVTEIAPVLISKCATCHDAKTRDGGYSIATPADLVTPGDSGFEPVIAGDVESEILLRLRSDDEEERMPAQSPALPEKIIDRFELWIKQGAKIDAPSDKPLAELIASSKEAFNAPEHYERAYPISAIAATLDGKTAIAAGYGELLFWKLEDSSLVNRLPVKGRRVGDIELSSDGKILVVSSGTPGSQGFIEVFDKQEDGEWKPSWERAMSEIPLDVAISPDSKFTLIGEGSGSLRLVRNESKEDVFVLASHAAAITAVAWSKDSSKFYSASRDRTAKSYKAENGEIIGSFTQHERVVGGVAESYNGVYTTEESGRLINWIEGINSHIVSQHGGFSARVNKLIRLDYDLIVLEENQIRVLQNQSKEVPDGEDKEGKPKTKWNNWFDEMHRLDAEGERLLSFSAVKVEDSLRILAGTNSGVILVWDAEEAKTPQKKLVSKP